MPDYPRRIRRAAPWIAVLMLAATLAAAGGFAAPPGATAAPPRDGYAPLDLVATASDPNGLPLNPSWRYQLDHGTPPDADALCAGAGTGCTTQHPTFDRPVGWNGAVCLGMKHQGGAFDGLAGHANWFNATYTGAVTWGHWSPEDGDNNLELVPPDAPGTQQNPAGLTTGHAGAIHAEFNELETLPHFTSTWWRNFESARQQGEYARLSNDPARIAAAKQNGWYNPGQINGKPAIISGLAGLDCEHACLMELHPVFAVAIHVRSDANDDVWAIFVRRSGNEGFCSSDQHTWDTQQVTFALPGLGGQVRVAAGTEMQRDSGQAGAAQAMLPAVRAGAGGALVTFDLGAGGPGDPLIDGELHLHWSADAAPTHPFQETRHVVSSGFWDDRQSHGGVAQ